MNTLVLHLQSLLIFLFTEVVLCTFDRYINYLFIEEAYRLISSWTQPQCNHIVQWSPCAGLGLEDPKKPTMGSDLQSPQGFRELAVQTASQNLAVFPIFYILLSVRELVWDPVLAWVLHDCDPVLHLVLSELSSPLDEVDVSAFLNTTCVYVHATP